MCGRGMHGKHEGCTKTKGETGAVRKVLRHVMLVIISKPQTESSLIPRPGFHGSLCPTE